jgi:hypothetical protein
MKYFKLIFLGVVFLCKPSFAGSSFAVSGYFLIDDSKKELDGYLSEISKKLYNEEDYINCHIGSEIDRIEGFSKLSLDDYKIPQETANSMFDKNNHHSMVKGKIKNKIDVDGVFFIKKEGDEVFIMAFGFWGSKRHKTNEFSKKITVKLNEKRLVSIGKIEDALCKAARYNLNN